MHFTDILCRLVAEGIFPGVYSVLSFIPTIAVAMFFISLLKESGIIRGTAAHLIMGFGCSVPAILSCAAINGRRKRYLTMILIPYMSCSAKLPIYVTMASMFFPDTPYAAVLGIYAIGILMAVIIYVSAASAGLLSSGNPAASCSSCKGRCLLHPKASIGPAHLKRPSMRNILNDVTECCTGFIKKAFTIILAASAILWLLQNLDASLSFTTEIEDSLLACLGRAVSPVLSPLGFGDWRAAAALITGLSAKEAVVSTFAVLAGAAEGPALCMMLEDIFSPLSAFCFMVFCLIYMPCAASLAAIKTITGRISVSLTILASQTVLAWLVTFLIFNSIKAII